MRVDPADPAYDWAIYDALVKRADGEPDQGRVLDRLDAHVGDDVPGKKNRAPKPDERPAELRVRGGEALQRQLPPASRTARRCPAVTYWLAWNEPNNPVFLRPQFPTSGEAATGPSSPGIYAKICNAIWRGVHLTGSAARRSPAASRRRAGTTAASQPRASLSPIAFLRGMKRARRDASTSTRTTRTTASRRDARDGRRRLEGPTVDAREHQRCLISELTRLYGPKRVWLTEYGYQTNPPRPARSESRTRSRRAISRSAFAIARAHPRIDMMIWFLMKDEARTGRPAWQSGFCTASRTQEAGLDRVPPACASKAGRQRRRLSWRGPWLLNMRPRRGRRRPPEPRLRESATSAVDERRTSRCAVPRGGQRASPRCIVLDLAGLVLGIYAALVLRGLVYERRHAVSGACSGRPRPTGCRS